MAGGDRLAPIVIFSILFIALTLAIVPQMVDVLYANAQNGGPDTDIGYEMIGGHQYQMWTTTSGGGIENYSTGGHVSEWGSWAGYTLNSEVFDDSSKDIRLNRLYHFDFYDPTATPPSHHRMDIWIVRNNTGYSSHLKDLQDSSPFVQTNGMKDFVFFREYAYCGNIWDNTHNFYDVVSFSQLVNPVNFVKGENNMTSFNILTKYNITYFAGPTPGSSLNLTPSLYSNYFSIQVGSDIMNMQNRAHIGMWNIVGDLFMFHSSELGMPDWLNLFISTILWVCVGFAVVGIISRFIPTIPGL